MRIVLVGRYQVSERLTGPEKFAKRLFTALQGTEHDVQFFDYFYRSGGLYNRLFGREQVTVHVFRLGIIPLLLRILRERPDIIHVVTAERFIIPLLLLRRLFSGRLIATVHGDAVAETRSGVEGGWKDRWMERLMMRRCDRIVAVSGRHQAALQNRYPSASPRTAVIAHGVDDRFRATSERPVAEGPLRAVMMERPSFVHDIGERIRASFRHSGAGGIVFTVIGRPGPHGDFTVRSIPPMEPDELAALLKEQHVVVNGALSETFSIFTAECMAAGVVPIINPNIGISEYIQNGMNGIVVPAGDAVAYVSALRRLDGDRALLHRLARGASETGKAMDWSSAARSYLVLYAGPDSIS